MPNDTSSATTAVAVESPDGAAASVGRERRVTEQLISDWQEETRRLGHALAFMTLNTSAMTGAKVGASVHHRRQSNGRAFLFALLRRWLCIASGIAAGTRQVRSDLRTAAGPIRARVHERLYHLVAVRCAYPEAGHGRA